MDHEQAREMFTAYHDGDLPGVERSALEEHLAGCGACAAEWETYRTTVEEISGLHRLMAPEGFTREVEQKIHRRSRGRFFGPQRPHSLQFAVVSFILIVLFVMAYLVMTYATEITVLEQDDAGAAAAEPSGQP